MTTVQVNVSKCYDVIIGNGLLDNIGAHSLEKLGNKCKIAIISDNNVWQLYGEKVRTSLLSSGFETCNYVFSPGESSKNANTYLQILNFLAKNQITRADALIALGGGVVGDMTGFAAATYLRGIRYIQVPTSLLAMVDSSVGGKTAIDLPAGKNLVGAFYQPALVLCDLNTLDTLPEDIFCDGCAEVIKYGILYDQQLFAHLEAHGTAFDRETVISRCVELKRNVVTEDEFDTGARQKLNLGHTFGHAIEALSDFTITHGQAVAIGTCLVTKAACPKLYNRIMSVFGKFSLPTATNYTANEILRVALADKKRAGGSINLIVPVEIGDCRIVKTPLNDLESFIKEGL